VHEEPSSPGIVTLAHLASPTEPVNGFYSTRTRIHRNEFEVASYLFATKVETITHGDKLTWNFVIALASLQHSLRD
jgi:hypothetical protein